MADTEQPTAQPTRSPKGAKSEADALKTAVIQLILTDKDIEQALRVTLGLSLTETDPPGQLGASDAEHAELVQTLIEQSIQKLIRPDALRRPFVGRT